jgi:hypothetical protein
VAELVRLGQGRYFDLRGGRLMNEWLAMNDDTPRLRFALAKEARRFVASLRVQ